MILFQLIALSIFISVTFTNNTIRATFATTPDIHAASVRVVDVMPNGTPYTAT